MISSYRLGDLVLLELNQQEKNELLNDHPESIGSQYIIKKMENNNLNNIDLITQIVMDNIEKYNELLPTNISESIVIHLRLGDVIAGNEYHERVKRPLDVSYLKSLIVDNISQKYVIGKCFFAKTSSTNYEECINASNEYLNNVLNELKAEYFNSGNADIDLFCGVKAKIFIQGKGYFSKLIVEIRKKLNLSCIETIVHD